MLNVHKGYWASFSCKTQDLPTTHISNNGYALFFISFDICCKSPPHYEEGPSKARNEKSGDNKLGLSCVKLSKLQLATISSELGII